MMKLEGRQCRVCLDPGHGGTDIGAEGPLGVHESAIALAVAKETMFQLEQLGIDSHLTRTADEAKALSARVEDSKGSDCFVSIHCNAVVDKSVHGIETVYGSQGKFSGPSKALANYVHQAVMSAAAGHKSRGLKASPSMDYPRKLYVLSMAAVPACLVELEFLSNLDQAKWLADEQTQRTLAHAIAGGIRAFLVSKGAVDVGGEPQAQQVVSPASPPEAAAPQHPANGSATTGPESPANPAAIDKSNQPLGRRRDKKKPKFRATNAP